MTDTTRLKHLAEQATPGPWDLDNETSENYVYCNDILGSAVASIKGLATPLIDEAQRKRNLQFIAAANPKAVLDLLSRLEKAENENTKLRRLADVRKALMEEYQSRTNRLQKYARHDGTKDYTGTCYCGLEELLSEIKSNVPATARDPNLNQRGPSA